MGKESFRGGLPLNRGYSEKEEKKSSKGNKCVEQSRSETSGFLARVNGSPINGLARFTPGARPQDIHVEELAVVVPATVNHVRGAKVIPLRKDEAVKPAWKNGRKSKDVK